MKTSLFVFAALVLAFGTARASVECQGTYVDSANRTVGIYVADQVGKDTLTVAMAEEGQQPKPWELQSYHITKVIPMFPVYSIEAQKDMRPVDGGLTQVVLAIQDEAVAIGGGGQPATLTVTNTGARGGSSKTTYSLSCVIKQ